MKFLTIFSLLLLPFISFAQRLYVHCEDIPSREVIENKLDYEGYKITRARDSADYIIECIIWCSSKFNSMYRGYIEIQDRNKKALGKTDQVRAGAVAINGYNASRYIFNKISKKYLIEELSKIVTSHKTE